VVAQPDKRHANRTASVLEWYDKYRKHLVQTNNNVFSTYANIIRNT